VALLQQGEEQTDLGGFGFRIPDLIDQEQVVFEVVADDSILRPIGLGAVQFIEQIGKEDIASTGSVLDGLNEEACSQSCLAATGASQRSGVIYADARANAVFLLLDNLGHPVGAELRGSTSLGWRGMAPGSRKDRGFFSVPAPTTQAIVLCESAIDALSCHVLHPDYRCLSTSGARPDPAWLAALMSEGLPIYCGFDADRTGEAMAQRMHELHPSIRRLRPPAKDWNDLLRQVVR
jgi:hypothetical protein